MSDLERLSWLARFHHGLQHAVMAGPEHREIRAPASPQATPAVDHQMRDRFWRSAEAQLEVILSATIGELVGRSRAHARESAIDTYRSALFLRSCSSIVRRSGVLTTDWDVPQFQKIRPRGSVAITRIDRAIRNFGNLMILLLAVHQSPN